MPSPQLIQILRSRSELTDAQITELTDEQGWNLVYEIDARDKSKREQSKKQTVCFTGFNKADKLEMEALAAQNGLKCVGGVSMSLGYLVTGDTPGESKISKAEAAGVKILQAHEFKNLFS